MNVVPTTPLTSVKVLNGIKFNSSYTDTLFFDSVSAQTSYFSGKAKFSFNNLTPIRLQNKIRLPRPADSLYDCSYVMFQNANFGTKWFYAFIKAIDYVNMNMCELTIELDVIQTWFFECNSFNKNQYILRETPPTNEGLFENIMPENFNINEYVVFDDTHSFTRDDSFKLVLWLATGSDELFPTISVVKTTGLYNGLTYRIYDTGESDITQLGEDLTSLSLLGRNDSIVALTMINTNFLPTDSNKLSPITRTVAINPFSSAPAQYPALDGYIPRRKKVYNYPFCYIGINNLQGTIAKYKFEYFNNTIGQFEMQTIFDPTATTWIVPRHYKNLSYNYDERTAYMCAHNCPIVTDTYKANLSQILSTVSSIGMGALGIATAQPVLAGASAAHAINSMDSYSGQKANFVGSAVSEIANASANVLESTPQASMCSSSTAMQAANGFFDVPEIIGYCAPASVLKTVDFYFEKYGYSVSKYKAIDFSNNNYWHYVQTMNSDFNGNVSFEDLAQINSIFDNGIRFWYDDDIGNYREGN